MASTCPGDRPASCSGRSSSSLHPLVAASRLSPNFTPSEVSSPFRFLSRSLLAGSSWAPARTKDFQVRSSSTFWSGSSPSASRPSQSTFTFRNRRSSSSVSSRCRVSRGAISRWMAWISGVDCAETSVPKTAWMRPSCSPEAPSAATVFAKVGASVRVAMASTSARCPAMAASKAGRKCPGWISPNGGRPKGAVHSARSGFETGGAAAASARARGRSAMCMVASRRLYASGAPG